MDNDYSEEYEAMLQYVDDYIKCEKEERLWR